VLREEWLDAYARAGGRVDDDPIVPEVVGAPVKACPLRRIDLRYRHADGSPVANARYAVKTLTGNLVYTGSLDASGYARIANVPYELSAFTYEFHGDPAPYQPALKPSQAPDPDATRSTLDEIGSWIWGTLQGDFNKDQSISQLAVNTLLGLIPLVDQALDVRDIISGLKDIISYYEESEAVQKKHEDVFALPYEVWLWVNVFIIALGCIPEFGSAIKGVLKALLHKLGQVGKSLGKLTPKEVKALWEELVAVLNYFGKGNAHEFLKKMLGHLDAWMGVAAVKVKAGLDAVRTLANHAKEYARSRVVRLLVDEKQLEKIVRRVTRINHALEHAYARLEAMKARVNAWLREQLEKALPGKHRFPENGAASSAEHVHTNERVQEAREPPGHSGGLLGADGKFVDAQLEADYQKYVARKGKQGKAPRDREDWKKQRDYWMNDSPMARGNAYNASVENRGLYDYNEVHLANGKRLDSYVPARDGKPAEIISRKATDFDDIEPDTFRKYVGEMKTKYQDTTIASRKYEDALWGKPLEGRQILEVPSTNMGAANRSAFEEIARSQGVEIRYTPE